MGFTAETAPLDDYIGKLPEEGAVVIVTASYNGSPPDNAAGFVEWLKELEEGQLKGVSYAVFGCGNRSWASTYQRIPRLIDDMMKAKGASRLTEIGEGDAADDFESHRESWENRFWKETMDAFDINEIAQKEDRPSLSITFLSEATETPVAKAYGAFKGVVLENRELQTADSTRSTRHIELEIPAGKTYKEGDHIGILPKNSRELVQRVLSRFGLQSNHVIKVSGSAHMAHLPMDRPIKVVDLLSSYVELQEPASRLQLRELASYTVCPPHQKELEQLVSDDGIYKEQVLAKRLTMLDFLEDYPACEMPFERFLALLPSLKPRYYSISSSPKVHANIVSMTVGVVKASAWSGRGEYRGVASNYLAELNTGDAAACFIRTPQSGFQMPDEPETPMIMVGPGTGIAPFRGFIQARSVLKKEGSTLGEALLYFGCRRPDHDDLYREELDQAEQDGLVTIRRCYSRIENEPKGYVQHLLKQDTQKLMTLIEKGAHIYVCGDGSQMAPDVEKTLRLAYEAEKGASQEESAEWLQKLQDQRRYVKDVWTGM